MAGLVPPCGFCGARRYGRQQATCDACGRALPYLPPVPPACHVDDHVEKDGSSGVVVREVNRRTGQGYLRVWVTAGPLKDSWREYPRDRWRPLLDRDGGTYHQVCRECNRPFLGAATDIFCRTCAERLEGDGPRANRW